jgi:hypothetical protein
MVMKSHYFKQAGLLYLPVHLVGWLVSVFAIAICVWFFIVIDRTSHSASDTLTRFFVYATCVAFWFKWFAGATCDKPDFTA